MFKPTETFEFEPADWSGLPIQVRMLEAERGKPATQKSAQQLPSVTPACEEEGKANSPNIGDRLAQPADPLREMVDLMPLPVAIGSLGSQKILYANALFLQIFGLSNQVTVADETGEFYRGGAGVEILQEVIKQNATLANCELRTFKVDGTPLWLVLSSRKVTFNSEAAILMSCCDITNSKREQEELIQKEQEYHRQLEVSSEPTLICQQGKIVYINWAGAQFFQASSPSELLGNPVENFLSNSQFKTREVIGGAMVEVTPIPVTYQGETATQFSLKNIKEEITKQETLQQTVEQLQMILDAVPGIVSWISSDLHYIKVNRHLSQVFGLQPDDFIGKDLGFLGSGPEFRQFICDFFAASATEAVQEMPTRINGYLRTYLVGLQKYNQGKAAFVVGMDITDRKEAEAALQKSEAKLRAVLNSSLPSILLIDTDYKVQAFNQTAQKGAKMIFGKTLREGESIYEYVKAEEVEQFNRDFQTALVGKFVRAERQFQGRKKSHWFEINYNPVLDSQGNVSGVYFSAINIDDRKKALEALAKSEERFRALAQHSSDMITIIQADGTICYESPSVEIILGYGPQQILGKKIFDYLHPEDKPIVISLFEEAVEKPDKVVKVEVRFRDAGGSWVFLEAVGSNRLDDAAIQGFVVNSRDITQRKQQEEQLRLLERAMQSSVNGIVITDAQQRDNPAVYLNPCFEKMTGYSIEEVLGKNMRFLQGKNTNQPSLKMLRKAIKEGKDCNVVVQNYHKNGSLFWNELQISPVYNDRGKLTHFIGIQTDITERKKAEEKLIQHAFYDSLTSLPNRAFLMERLAQAMERYQQQYSGLCAVLFLDLDRFKVVNDSLGHSLGDKLLTKIANRLTKCLNESKFSILNSHNPENYKLKKPNSLVARLGGDHFVILLEGVRNSDEVTELADAIHRELVAPFNLDGYEVFISTSIGIALSSTSYYGQGDLLRDADIAMFQAKAQGKARSAIFDKAMHERAVALLQLENDLRRAIEREEFQVYYQPLVCLKTGHIAGFEALVRWHHPARGMISPAEFIPVAEETGLILPLGSWVLRQACRQLRFWQEIKVAHSHSLTISVNLSGKQFLQADLVEQIDEILAETGLNPACLKLEITESVLVDNTDFATEILLQLRSRNIKLSLDDFGTGYSSLSYLHRFPIDTLKIDRSFLNRTGINGNNTEIVRAIVMLAHSMGMDVVAEGVEMREQLAQLNALGCEYGQGFFFSKPVPAESAFASLLCAPDW